MFTPGQLIRQQRLRRAWTQEQLAQAAEVGQSAVSRYEGEGRYPSWSQLCRILGAMGMQPRVVAEPCDFSQHGASAWVRSDRDERDLEGGVPPIWGERGLDLAAVLRPHTAEPRPRLYDLVPLLDLLEAMEFVLVGRVALRLHGLGCTVPRVEAVLGAEPGAALWEHLAVRLEDGAIGVWSAEWERYCWRPDDGVVARVAALTTIETPTGASTCELSLRTRDTATEIRVLVRDEPLPPHVTRRIGQFEVPLLALSEFAGAVDPQVAAALHRLLAPG